jgi:outer membrane cobalamin receptor
MKPFNGVVALIAAACGATAGGHRTPDRPAGGFLITAEEIQRSGARTAWQVLRDQAPILLAEEDQNGRPVRLTRRGRASLLLNDAPMVLLDGVLMPDFRNLDAVEAQSIQAIMIYDGIEGTTYYGTNAVSGVIVIKMKNGQQS